MNRRRVFITLVAVVALSSCTRAQPSPPGQAGSPGPANPGASPTVKTLSETATIDDQSLQLAVVSLARSGDTMTLKLRLTNPGPHAVSAEGLFAARSNANVLGLSLIALLDLPGRKAYLPLARPSGTCQCTSLPVNLAPGSTTDASATFSAPPPGVTAMLLTAPHYLPIDLRVG